MTTTKSKVLKIPLKEMVSEHKRIVPELKKAGLKQEYKKQSRELSDLLKKIDKVRK